MAWIYCEKRDAFIEKEQFYREKYGEVSHARSHFPRPVIRSDNIEFVSQIDGTVETSRSRYLKKVRERGLEIADNDYRQQAERDYREAEIKKDKELTETVERTISEILD